MYELVYTSTPQGLLTGRSGFTTVALTDGFPPNMIAPVENMSGYKPLFPPGHENELFNPVNYSCQEFHLGKSPYIVLSRISFAGLSYTGRSNVLAHHLLFSPEELDEIPGGAVSVLRAQENFPPWSGNPRMLSQKKKISVQPPPQGSMWQKLTGDQRWAAYTAECFRTNPEKSFSLAFDPLQISGAEILELIAETTAYLKKDELRRFAFSTYSYSSGIANPLFFRSYVNDSAQLGSIKRLDPDSVIHLGQINKVPSYWEEPKPVQEVVQLYPEEEISEPAQPEPLPIRIQPEPESSDTEKNIFLSSPAFQGDPEKAAVPPLPPLAPHQEDIRQLSFPAEEEEKDSGVRKYIILTLVFLAALFLCGAVVWRIFIDPQNLKTNQDNTSELENLSLEDNRKSTVSAENKSSDIPSKKVTRSMPLPQRTPQRKKKAPPAPETRSGTLNAKELIGLYRCFYTGGKYRLPPALSNATAIELKIDSIGGLKEKDLVPKCLTGNKSRRVIICSRRKHYSDISEEWVPDKSPDGQMHILLSQEGFLQISLPLKKSPEVPVLSDITEFIFLFADGSQRCFAAKKLPSAIDTHLNRDPRITVHCSSNRLKYALHVSDDLWTFRNFYLVYFNDSNLGRIDGSSREIPLREIDLNPTIKILIERNEALKRLNVWQKRFAQFQKSNRKDLIQPTLANKNFLEKNVAKDWSQTLMRLIQNNNEKELKTQRSLLENKLSELISQEKITAEKQTAFLKNFDDFIEKYRHFLKVRAEYKQIQKSLNSSENDYKRKNQSLKENLQDLPPVFYKKCRLILNRSSVLDPDFYRKITPEEYKKDIKIKIERKVSP